MAIVYISSWLVCIVFILHQNTCGEEVQKYPRRRDLELITRYRNVVEQKISNGGCRQDYNLLAGSSIFQDYSYWDKEIRTANNVANYLTSMWRFKGKNNRSFIENQAAIYSLTKTIVSSSEQIYGSIVCFDEDKFQSRRQFCPYAYKNSTAETNRTIIRDLGRSNDYLTTPSKNDSKHSFIWWHICRGFTNATEQLRQNTVCYDTDLDNPTTNSLNVSNSKKYYNITSSYVPIKHGKWTTPYYDCFGGQTWVITYLSPFYNEANTFL